VSLGIYIHIPFCQAKCSYCHFISIPFRKDVADLYGNAVVKEIAYFPGSLDAEEVNSIYFGGGTPSLVPADHLADILGECHRRFRITEECEVSMESNPGTMSADKLAIYRQAGINRVSMGAQSFDDRELSSIGRLHSAGMISESLRQLRESGFININLDLMLGLPGQTEESWQRSLAEAARLSPPHVSVYMLDLDERSQLFAIDLPDDDLVSDLYLETIRFLTSCGYAQYEISNFALPGFACRHNLKYWRREAVLGFGLGSHSFDLQSRYANCSQMEDYLNAMEKDVSPVSWREPVSDERALQETFFLGLRLSEGVDCSRLQNGGFGNYLEKYEDSLQDLHVRGLIERNGSIVRLTQSGMLLSNEIFQLFV
jgi:oxygen-independent coproporphyrinogen III oxidase